MKEQIEKRKKFIKENNKDVELGKEVRPGVKLTKINPETDSYIQDCKFGLKEAQEKRLNEFIRSKKRSLMLLTFIRDTCLNYKKQEKSQQRKSKN